MEDRQCVQLLRLLKQYWEEYGKDDHVSVDDCTVRMLANDIESSLPPHSIEGLEVLGVTP